MDDIKQEVIRDFIFNRCDEVTDVYKDLYFLYKTCKLYLSPQFYEMLEKELELLKND